MAPGCALPPENAATKARMPRPYSLFVVD